MSKNVGRAFIDALAAHGGSIPIWVILDALKPERRRTQLELARAVGIEGPTIDPCRCRLDDLRPAPLAKLTILGIVLSMASNGDPV